MQRRSFLGLMATTAAGLLVPRRVVEPAEPVIVEQDPRRVYSFAPGPMSSVHLIANGEIIQRWYPGEWIGGFAVNGGRLRPTANEVAHVQLRRVGSKRPLLESYMSTRANYSWVAFPGEAFAAAAATAPDDPCRRRRSA